MGTHVQMTMIAVACVVSLLAPCLAQDVLVTVQQGTLRGAVVTSVLGTPYISFKGVPYAQPPVGSLRFQAPQPAASWEGVRDALEQSEMCMQPVSGVYHVGSEDCLYLNVHVPMNASGPLPVLAWIPGGGFTNGASSFNGPDFFIEEGVIVVSLQQRVGALGLLSTGDDVVPGNAGMKDIVMALRWVQQNIAAFGGDPDRVTVGGESAGACSTSHLIISPLADGLFRAAILHSGEAVSSWGVGADPAVRAFRLGEALGFSTNDSRELLEFLLAQDAADLVTHDDQLLSPEEEAQLPLLVWMPVIEPDVEGAFITEWPATALKEGRFSRVPVITGFTSGDGLEPVSRKQYLDDAAALQQLSDSFVAAVSPQLHLPTPQQREEAALKLRDFYFGHENITASDAQALVDMLTDLGFGEPVDSTVRVVANHTDAAPVYYYLFDYRGEELGNTTYGTPHATQSSVVFYLQYLPILADPESTFGRLRSTMTRLWTNFIKYETPSPEGEEIVWEPFDNSNLHYLHITDTFELKQNVYKERMDFWHQNIPL
ncbi:carboxylesterase 4A-like [Schistocerca cancellata]|uniref:carboxylesterase 4A-like n=1 Tax=Schistocerca cancellata TaxID=274614 RepID=UPI0021176153|nr:carboxylesterase 4A-like [Schistocerca cancellata]